MNERAIGGVFDSYRWWTLTERQQKLYMGCLEHSNGFVFNISKHRFSWIWKIYHRDDIEFANDMQRLIYEGFVECTIGHPYSKHKSRYIFSKQWKKLDEKAGLREKRLPFLKRIAKRYWKGKENAQS